MDTKTRIIKAAEKLFATHGVEGASMRLICSEAGVNSASINYHFGSKENLVREIFVRLVIPIDTESNRLLKESTEKAEGKPLPIIDLVRAFLEPWFEFRKQHPEFIAAYGQFYNKQEKPDNQYFRDLVRAKAKGVHTFFTDAACEALPNVRREDMLMRINMAVAAGYSMLVNAWLTESLEDISGMKITDDLLLKHTAALIEFGLAGGDQ